MAANPTWTSTPRLGVAAISAANTARDGSGTLGIVLTGAVSGTRIERVVAIVTGDAGNGVLNFFLHDGTTAYFYDDVDYGDPNVGAVGNQQFRFEKAYRDLILPSTDWSLRVSSTVAVSSGAWNVFAFGGDLT